MPELPEVETIRCCLLDKVVGRRIDRVYIRRGSRLLRDTVSSGAIRAGLRGAKIEAIGRRGKYLIFALDTGDHLVVHLGMTGQLYTLGKNDPAPPHTHVRLELDRDSLTLVDPRTFGRIFLVNEGELGGLPALARLGPEPLDKSFTVRHFRDLLARRNTSIKAVLLDQSLAAGIGNIYADEACFRAGINPLRRASSLSDPEINRLRRSIRAVIRESIRCKGTTLEDGGYIWDAGQSGDFARKLRIYGREGEACLNCGEKIIREAVAGRSAFYCPTCQR